jgi:DnaJ family protein C protein 12
MVEYKIRALECHPDKCIGDPEAEKRFKSLQEAKDILTDSERRSQYDKWLNSGVSIPFQKWLFFNKTGQTFHWIKNPVTKPMIHEKDCSKQTESAVKTSSRQDWESESNPWLDKFRNYDI